ncbi:hypothetical protein niasHT_006034 [Heterodera trifolii]|uniref:Uncharacterized protein n=1 Tax=Heterodera trifolii TaxID=157864 RepID=A0ABD2M778_9BILA
MRPTPSGVILCLGETNSTSSTPRSNSSTRPLQNAMSYNALHASNQKHQSLTVCRLRIDYILPSSKIHWHCRKILKRKDERSTNSCTTTTAEAAKNQNKRQKDVGKVISDELCAARTRYLALLLASLESLELIHHFTARFLKSYALIMSKKRDSIRKEANRDACTLYEYELGIAMRPTPRQPSTHLRRLELLQPHVQLDDFKKRSKHKAENVADIEDDMAAEKALRRANAEHETESSDVDEDDYVVESDDDIPVVEVEKPRVGKVTKHTVKVV